MPSVAPDKVILTVGDLKITAAQFDMIVNSIPEQNRASARGGARKIFAEQLVRVLVMAQEGHRRKLDEDPAYKVQTMIQGSNALAGMTYEQLNKESREGKVPDAEVREYYEKHRSEFEQVRARQIYIRVQGAPVPSMPGKKELTDAEALAKAQDLRKKLIAGADFATLAKAESDDAQSAAKGGDLGILQKGQNTPSFEEAAAATKPGEVSEPVKSPLGYHIIKVESKTTTKSLDDARAELEQRIRPELVKKKMDEIQAKTAVVYDTEFFGPAKQ